MKATFRRRRGVDEETGEIFWWHEVDDDGRPLVPRSRSAPEKRVDWATVYLPALAELSADSSLTGGEMRLLLHLMARAPLGECQRLSRASLARTLGVHRHTVDRAWTGLVRRGVVVADPDEPGCCWVSPELFWRGYRRDQERQRQRLASVG